VQFDELLTATMTLARFAMRVSDGPIFPAALRTMMSPGSERIISTTAGVGRLRSFFEFFQTGRQHARI
jgi:hypothetical protein